MLLTGCLSQGEYMASKEKSYRGSHCPPIKQHLVHMKQKIITITFEKDHLIIFCSNYYCKATIARLLLSEKVAVVWIALNSQVITLSNYYLNLIVQFNLILYGKTSIYTTMANINVNNQQIWQKKNTNNIYVQTFW